MPYFSGSSGFQTYNSHLIPSFQRASTPPQFPSYEEYNVSKSFVIHHPRSPFSGFDTNAGDPVSLFSSRFGPDGKWHLSLIVHPFLTAQDWTGDKQIDEFTEDDDNNLVIADSLQDNEPATTAITSDTQKTVVSDDTFYIEAVFNSDDELQGSVSFEFATVSGEVLRSDSKPMFGESTHTIRCTEREAGTDLTYILFTIRVVTSSRPTGFPLYNPVQVTNLLTRMLDGNIVQDVKYVLRRRKPRDDDTKKGVGYVYADRSFLSSKCEYFKNGEYTFSIEISRLFHVRFTALHVPTDPPDDDQTTAPMSVGLFKDDRGCDSDYEDEDSESELGNGDDNEEPALPEKVIAIPIGDVAYKTYVIYFCYFLLLTHIFTITKMEGDDFLSIYRQHSICASYQWSLGEESRSSKFEGKPRC
jgi:hypothetical protein